MWRGPQLELLPRPHHPIIPECDYLPSEGCWGYESSRPSTHAREGLSVEVGTSSEDTIQLRGEGEEGEEGEGHKEEVSEPVAAGPQFR